MPRRKPGIAVILHTWESFLADDRSVRSQCLTKRVMLLTAVVQRVKAACRLSVYLSICLVESRADMWVDVPLQAIRVARLLHTKPWYHTPSNKPIRNYSHICRHVQLRNYCIHLVIARCTGNSLQVSNEPYKSNHAWSPNEDSTFATGSVWHCLLRSSYYYLQGFKNKGIRSTNVLCITFNSIICIHW
jgi:hypothetical protein